MMTRDKGARLRTTMATIAATLLIAATACAQPAGRDITAGDYVFSGPHTHKNLTIYLIHGRDRVDGKNILTLQEALDRKLVKVYETGSVNELSIENISRDKEVFVQAGDIVRGGRQDRVLSYDLILQPKSGRVGIASFCVEQGRWRQRGGESASEFNSSQNQLAGRELKLMAKRDRSQTEVWKKVEEAQTKLSENLGVKVNNDTSATSMELALGNENVRANAEEYVKALKSIIDGRRDVIGFAFAINGSVNSSDVYGSSTLFRKLWPKLLQACAVEAIAETRADAPTTQPSVDEVRKHMVDPETGAATTNDVNRRVRVVVKETKENVYFETRDRDNDDAWIHRNYIRLE